MSKLYYEVYALYDGIKNADGKNEYLFNVAITEDIIGLFKFCKENSYIWKYLDRFALDDKDDMCEIVDDENIQEKYGIQKVIMQKLI